VDAYGVMPEDKSGGWQKPSAHGFKSDIPF
jgi:hypothetical protein